MKTAIQDRRVKAGVTLRELAKALGPNFSTARLSLAERALIRIPAHEEKLILESIDRLGPLCANRRRIVEVAREVDFGPILADLREARAAHA
jgi:hypothetical protein